MLAAVMTLTHLCESPQVATDQLIEFSCGLNSDGLTVLNIVR